MCRKKAAKRETEAAGKKEREREREKAHCNHYPTPLISFAAVITRQNMKGLITGANKTAKN